VAVLVTTVTGESGSGRTLQASIIILKSIGVWYIIVFAKFKCNFVTHRTELKTVLMATKLNLNLNSGNSAESNV